MKRLPVVLVASLYSLLFTFNSSAQNIGINTTGADPDNSALLDLSSEDKGFLITRVDTAKIAKPAFGLMTLSPLDSCLYMFNGKPKGRNWINLGGVGENCGTVAETPGGGTTFECGKDELVDIRDENKYPTVQIGKQCWMGKNLAYQDEKIRSYCYDNEEDKFCKELDLGRLYQWPIAMNGEESSYENPSGVQGICPDGWHLPSDAEWSELEVAIDMDKEEAYEKTGWRGEYQGEILKATEKQQPLPWDGGDKFGFTALPGGMFDGTGKKGVFREVTESGFWWTASLNEKEAKKAYMRSLTKGNNGVERNSHDIRNAHSIRCVKD